MRFVRTFSLACAMLAATVPLAAPVGAAPPTDPALTGLPAKMVAALITNDAAALRAMCAPSLTVVDEFAPYSWSGADACVRWSAAFKAWEGQVKMSGAKGVVAPHPFTDVTGSRGYLVAKVKFDAMLAGKPISEEGTWTFVLAKTGTAWKITSLAWGTLHH